MNRSSSRRNGLVEPKAPVAQWIEQRSFRTIQKVSVLGDDGLRLGEIVAGLDGEQCRVCSDPGIGGRFDLELIGAIAFRNNAGEKL